MSKFRHIIFLAAVIFCLAGCQRYDIEEILLQRNDISLTIKGEDALVYDPLTFQIGYNADKNEFRIFDDNLGNWFVLKCHERPSSSGQTLTADLRWTTASSTRTKNGLLFRVEKTDSKGHIWMWCDKEAIGIVVKEL
ncbi:MAG: hypothetical protein IKY66_02935 [Bacteroidales bacterium]|nr:hypothetical protein [Bacteroidales bacterium]